MAEHDPLERREALRTLDRRLTALTVDVDLICDPANRAHVWAGPASASFDVATHEPEARVLGELIEISAELRGLTDAAVPDIPTDPGWSVTASERLPEYHALIDELRALVREAFAAVEAELPELDHEPLAALGPDPEDADLLADGDHRERNRKLFGALWVVVVVSSIAWLGLVDMDAVALACAPDPPCESDDPLVALHPNGWIVVQRKTASCEDGVRVLFDREGKFIEQLEPGELPTRFWPKQPARAQAPCSDMDSLRWTWVIGMRNQ